MIINETESPFLTDFVIKVLQKTSNKKQYGLDKDITILDYDLDRIYLKISETQEFTIRTWDYYEYTVNKMKVRWTLFINIRDENGGGHGEELSNGLTIIEFPNEDA